MKKERKKWSKKRKLAVFSAAFVIVILLFWWGFLLKTVRYSVSSPKLKDGLKIVFISDLHNCFYGGTDQSGITDLIDKEDPDIVIFGGDVIDMYGGTKYAEDLMKKVNGKYPCFYTPGNHEESRDDSGDFYQTVRDIGITVLIGDYADITVRDQDIRIFGIIDNTAWGKNASQLDEAIAAADSEHYNILIAHQPEQKDDLLAGDFDLILSGHAHGGQWRIPGILDQGLYAPDQGLCPEYTTGKYTYGDKVHIISTGLAKPLRMIFIPRIFNRPEFSVIEISGR